MFRYSKEIIVLLLLLFPLQAQSHNGAAALAYPIEGITLDGDLSDWPQDGPRYPIRFAEYGDAPNNKSDFQASFQVGYHRAENALYVAVEVTDESTVLAAPNSGTWNTQDGCEIYVGVGEGHLPNSTRSIQYAVWGDRDAQILQAPGSSPNLRYGSNRAATAAKYLLLRMAHHPGPNPFAAGQGPGSRRSNNGQRRRRLVLLYGVGQRHHQIQHGGTLWRFAIGRRPQLDRPTARFGHLGRQASNPQPALGTRPIAVCRNPRHSCADRLAWKLYIGTAGRAIPGRDLEARHLRRGAGRTRDASLIGGPSSYWNRYKSRQWTYCASR